MARRSPANARYQKFTGPEGKTRKSASQAKPKRASSGPGSPTGAKSKSGAKVPPKPRVKVPETPEYLAARKLWWILLGAGLVLTTISWLVRAYVHTSWANAASAIALGIAYAMIFYALYIDWTRLRPARKAMIAGKTGAKSGKSAKSENASGKKAAADKTATETDTTTVEEHDSADRKDA